MKPLPARAGVLEGGTEPVVLGPLFWVAEHRIGLLDLFELLLGRGVVFLIVRVVFAGQFLVGSADLLLVGGARDA
jgi:hypothetical protein